MTIEISNVSASFEWAMKYLPPSWYMCLRPLCMGFWCETGRDYCKICVKCIYDTFEMSLYSCSCANNNVLDRNTKHFIKSSKIYSTFPNFHSTLIFLSMHHNQLICIEYYWHLLKYISMDPLYGCIILRWPLRHTGLLIVLIAGNGLI